VRIGRNVWIASGAIILPGVTVGDDAIIGAGSVVTCDVPAGATALGNPARVRSQGDLRASPPQAPSPKPQAKPQAPGRVDTRPKPSPGTVNGIAQRMMPYRI
jgi:serine acetyltransferase